jgi:alkylhydroperoxidase family enzyme
VRPALARRALRRSLTQIQYVSAVPPGAARGLVAAVYAQAERDFGMLAPPVALHSPAPGPLAACWIMLRETLLARGVTDRAAREAVAAGVSLGSSCPYCAAVHTATLHSLLRGGAAAGSGRVRDEPDGDPLLRAITAWARASGRRAPAGDDEGAGTAGQQALPLPAGQILELAGVAVTFQYLNRMVNVFLGESPLPPGVPAALSSPLMRVLGGFLRSAARSGPAPGASLTLLPDAPLPGDLSWAAGSPRVASAFARAAAAIDAAGAAAAGEPVRELILGELTRWGGQPPGPSRAWADDAVARLAAADRPAARLGLLTALASYQVSRFDIADFQRWHPGDQALVGLTSWSSLAAARRVGTWLGEPSRRSSASSA